MYILSACVFSVHSYCCSLTKREREVSQSRIIRDRWKTFKPL